MNKAGFQDIITIDYLNDHALGVSYHNGKIFNTPFTIPGEVVKIEILGKKKGALACKLLDIIESSPKRVSPLCPCFGVCGGCEMQHISYDEQVAIKQRWIKQLFASAGQTIIRDIIPSPEPYHYRNRITLHHLKKTWGFYKRLSHELIAIDECKIASQPLNLKLKLKTVNKTAPQEAEVFELREDAGHSFQQVNSAQNQNLIDTVCSYCLNKKSLTALELYCGSGNLSFEITKKFKTVMAVDGDPEAVRQAQVAKKNRGEKNIQFIHSPVYDAVFNMVQELRQFDVVVCDPPREGLRETARLIPRLKPRRIICVSCNPSSLASDARVLIQNGYQLSEITPIDMFPQTRHVETVACFDPKN
ncbi:MAG: class I SAM-dependent RNA methyltransferase [Deltaproteobacteria bacterium]|nr:class I SAM-dependent RNA methyltransferase [Deltaproteobacteria bacterium]